MQESILGIYLIAIAFFSLPMLKIWQILFITWAVFCFFLLKSAQAKTNKTAAALPANIKSFPLKLLLFFFIFFTAISIQIIPLIKHQQIYTGFDTGYYRNYLVFKNHRPPGTPFHIMENSWLVRKIFDLFRIAKIPANISIFLIPAAFTLISIFGIYLIGKEIHSDSAGIIGAFLFAASPIQFLTFQYLFIKNIIAISLLIFFFLAFIKFLKQTSRANPNKKTILKLQITCLGALSLILLAHRTTTFIASAVLIFFALICFFQNFNTQKIKKRSFYLLLALIFFAIGIWVNFPAVKILLKEILSNFKDFDPFAVKEGIFLAPKDYLLLSASIIPLALFGYLEKIREKELDIFFAFSTVCLIWILFQLIFYKRIIIFLDLAVIFLAMPPIAKILNHNSLPKLYKSFFVFILIFSSAFIGFKTALSIKPEISAQELKEMQNLAQLPEGTALAMSSTNSSWIYGWTPHRIIAPGLFENLWPYDVWKSFWDENNPIWFERKKELIALYNREPLYIFTGENIPLPALPKECLEKISEMVWVWKCD
ncbi:MAG: glycosyltransferase family 39 protein [bacterium]